MKSIALFFLSFFVIVIAFAQNRMPVENSGPIGKTNDINLSVGFPLGENGKYYSLGVGIDYDRTLKTMGEIKRGKTYDYQAMRINVNAGYDLLIGKDRTIGGVKFRNDPFSIIHIFPEFEYDPCEVDEISLGVGPAYGFGSGEGEFGFGASLYNTYFFDPNKSRSAASADRYWGIGAGLEYYKLGKGDPFVLGGIRITMTF